MWRKLLGKTWRAMPVWARRTVIRATQPSFTVSAAVVVIDDVGRVLLLNHILRPASGWGVPGGFLNVNEQPPETALREVFEETGLKVTILEMFRVQTINRHVEFWFVGRASGEAAVKSREILEAKWFRFSEMPPEMSKKEQRLIEQALQIGEKLQN
ncbi:MAG: NUDIX domain-containing protein [Pyrinomonadaceae bacterium]